MSENKMSECCSCAFQWPTGQHGGHSCSSYLSTENTKLKKRAAELEGLLLAAKLIIETSSAVTDTVWFDGFTTLCDKIELTLDSKKEQEA